MPRVLHRYEGAVLKALADKGSYSLDALLGKTGLGRDAVMWALESLAQDLLVKLSRLAEKSVTLTEEGRLYARSGLPEERLVREAQSKALNVSDFKGEEERIGLQWAKKKGYITISNGVVKVTQEGTELHARHTDEGVLLHVLVEGTEYSGLSAEQLVLLPELERRGLLQISEKKGIDEISITEKGIRALEGNEKEGIEALDKSIIAGRTWRERGFKEYNVNVAVEGEPIAVRHPLRSIINEIRRAYVGLGFSEISGPIVEPSFWVFDSLFMPQDHPARDIQDTFYLKEPGRIKITGNAEVERMKKVHIESWKSGWSREVAEQAVLRTQTTNVTIRYVKEVIRGMLKGSIAYRLPLKHFTIGRVFRNENIDYKHLTDFYQTDGVAIGKELTLANLFDILISLYGSLGMDVRFKPSYFPFVEPGLEVYAKAPKSETWIEMGGAGLIRSEITGISRKSITVLAWGLGIERMLLLRKRGISSIAELYNNSIGWLRRQEVV